MKHNTTEQSPSQLVDKRFHNTQPQGLDSE